MTARRDPEIAPPLRFDSAPIPGVESEARRFDSAGMLADLVACRQLIDSALKRLSPLRNGSGDAVLGRFGVNTFATIFV